MSAENELPASWATARLDEVCTINGRGFTPFVSGGEQPVAFVPMAAVVEEFGGIDVSARRPLGEVTKGYTAFVEGDVLFAKITPCMENGKVAVVPPLSTHIGFGSTEFHVLRSAGAVEPKWVGYHLSQLQFRRAARQDMTGSAGQLRVQSSWLAGAGIPVAPIAEQRRVIQRIDELLSDLDAGVLELVTAKRKLSQYRQSLLKAAIEGALTAEWRGGGDHLLVAGSQLPDGWNWVPIQQCCRVASGYAFSSKSFVSQGTAVSKIANVGHGNYLDDADPDYLDTSFELSHSDCLVEHGDVLIALTRPITRGALKSCRYPVGRPRALLNQRVAALRPLDPALTSYLFYVTRSAYFRNRMAAAATQTLQPNVSPLALRRFLVPIPAVEEAVVISDFLDHQFAWLDLVEVEIEKALVNSVAQRQNILRAAFAGQLVPQDPADEPASALLARIRAERAQRPAAAKRMRRSQPQPATP